MINILELLKDGPVPTRKLLKNRKGSFRLAYAKLLREGKIVESGSGTKIGPKYTGLPGAAFPAQRITLNPADVVLLRLAGASEEDARKILLAAIAVGGEDALIQVCGVAEQKLYERGLKPFVELPRAMNRVRKGKPFMSVERFADWFPEGV